MEISILFNHVGLSFLFGLFVFIATFATALHAKKAKAIARQNEIEKEREWIKAVEQKRLINEAILTTFNGANSDDYFKYYQAQEVAKQALKKASVISD